MQKSGYPLGKAKLVVVVVVVHNKFSHRLNSVELLVVNMICPSPTCAYESSSEVCVKTHMGVLCFRDPAELDVIYREYTLVCNREFQFVRKISRDELCRRLEGPNEDSSISDAKSWSKSSGESSDSEVGEKPSSG